MTLELYVQRLAAAPFVFGECDCMLALADWVRELNGTDVGRLYRGHYSTEAGWQAIVAAAGGLVPLVDRLATLAGIVRVPQPQPGDIGVVDLPLAGHAGAILAGKRWVVKLNRGLLAAAAPPVVASWGVR